MKGYLNNLKLRNKFYLLFFVGVLIPMVITDWMILHNIIQSSNNTLRSEMEKCALAVEYGLQKNLEYPVTIAHNLYKSQVMEDFLNQEYKSPADYYNAFYDMKSSLLFDSNIGIEGGTLSIYADNPTIVNGSGFYRLDKESEWYQAFEQEKRQSSLHFIYEQSSQTDRSMIRKVVLYMRMDMDLFRGCEKILRLELDYSNLAAVVDELKELNRNYKVTVCMDTTIVLDKNSSLEKGLPFKEVQQLEKGVYRKVTRLYDQDLTINVVPEKKRQWEFFGSNGLRFAIMLLINIVLPMIMLRMIESSITKRIQFLESAFERKPENDELELITRIEGNDEVTSLMRSYNRMAIRMNELIMTVYKDKLHEQEINIARQNAELLALHSQINPHFLFNALESIRMHSLMRGETETAEMVGKLAVMERTYVNWGGDAVSISKEMDFVEAYLLLQKYRFGDRLNYKITVDPDCEQFGIPKLTIVTFVENACIHGVEQKSTPTWIFIRASKKNGWMRIEIEDTGEGMDEKTLSDLNERVKNVTIEDMKNKKHVGMMNAYLRLKKMTKGLVRFEITSEERVGTVVKIEMPLEIRI
ncbi:MAG: histidine kinase [Lachnospiraceae bacterium]|nr:histidine kinase [Lachnospiraceae bacterium]